MMPIEPTTDEARRRQEVAGWFLRRDAGDGAWSAADEAAFTQWLGRDAGNRQAYARWATDWALIDTMPRDTAARLRALVAAERAPAAVPVPRRRAMAGWALAGVAAVAVTGGWFGWQHLEARPVYEQAFGTRRGQQSHVTLPDGSELRLDTSTTLKVTFFRGRREVQLVQGQALFTVRADPGRPFQVTAQDVRVTVVGTRFTVRSTPGIPSREGVEVAVEHGRVRVANGLVAGGGADAAAHQVELTAGQHLVLQGHGAQPVVKALPRDGAAPWHQGAQISFSNAPLKTVMAEMGRYADLGLVDVDPSALDLRLSGTFDPRDAATARRLLAGALQLQLVPLGDGYALRRQGG
ncbi:hypothetical protein ASF11_21470 [Acidovorax sp. Leaf76]|uniref:FecR family protein n=1 Tax=unclassified Acidovorax TaxID=2684926 RepID=UPI0006FE141B|nr:MULTISPECIES: FecR domain-containing protein [unclassified Acidovorax]KQO24160.1 hypothetical protein ASF11_21470 [Acidovorax sp. Leaf76]KQO37084.1 hypothetical protein ASF19_20985 [Acidovorax sp. Leaf84]KQS29242.1 hypothetical protein ASG27_13580 [Acidovorax sp. Leaf191]